MLNQFSRTQLVLGGEAMDVLSGSRVAVFGIGGVGGYTVEALARSGVGALDLIDDDRVCLTNVNRQILATRETVGKFKVDVAEARVHSINPNCKVTTYKTFFLPGEENQFDFSQFDYVGILRRHHIRFHLPAARQGRSAVPVILQAMHLV